jgi:hypothetical protein
VRLPRAALDGAKWQHGEISNVVILFPRTNGSASEQSHGAPHERPMENANGSSSSFPLNLLGSNGGERPMSHDPLDCLAKLDRHNSSHIEAVVRWLASSTIKSA